MRKAALALIFAAQALLLLIVLSAGRRQNPDFKGLAWGETTEAVSFDSLPGYLAGLAAVQELPEDAVIQLRLGERSYAVGKRVAEGTAADPDLDISLDPGVMARLSGGICPAVRKARAGGELRFKLNKNPASLLWKYRGVAKYQACFF